jgi:hypothetical protein
MAKGFPGADSCTPVTEKMIEGATKLLGSAPVFWGRYFTSVSTAGTVEYRHSTESPALNAAGIRLLPVGRQTGHVGGSSEQGIADGTANAQDFISTFGAEVLAEQGGRFYLFLDVEGSPSLSQDYYAGWVQGLTAEAASASAGSSSEGSVQILPCVYATQSDKETWLAVAAAVGAGVPCYGAWIARYYTGECAMGDWRPEIVTPAAPVPLPCPILAWQYAGNCMNGEIDCSQTNPEMNLNTQLLAFLVLPPA